MSKDEKLIYKMTRTELLHEVQDMTAKLDWLRGENDDLRQQNKQLMAQGNAMLMGSAVQLAKELVLLAAQGKIKFHDANGNPDPVTHTTCIQVGLAFARSCRDILSDTPEAKMEQAADQPAKEPDGAEVVGLEQREDPSVN